MPALRIALLVCLAVPPSLAAELPCNGGLSAAGRRIREVRIDSAGNTLSGITLPVKKGDILTPDLLGQAEAAINERIKSEQFPDIENQGAVQVVLTRSCVLAVEPGQVDVIITPWAVRVPLSFGGQAPLNQTGSGKAVLRSRLSAAQRALNLKSGVSYDRRLDASVRGSFSTSLIDLRNSLARVPDAPHNSDFQISGDGRRSMESENYFAFANAGYEYRSDAAARKFGVGVSYLAAREPWGDDSRLENAVRSTISYRFGTHGRLRGGGVALTYRWSGNRTESTKTTENAGEVRAALGYRLPGGGGATSLFADTANPGNASSYSRIALRSGYSGEIPVFAALDADGKKLDATHTLGVDLQLTAGKGSNSLPDYAQFRGGGDAGRFVVDESLDSQLLKPFFTGPVLRGYGQFETAAASSYWGVNANLAIPISRWARFLIPPDRDEDGHTLAERIEGAGLVSSENLMAAYYENEEHMAPDVAARKAKADIDSVRPAVRYIARYAKLYAVRPLLMFDAAQFRHPASGLASDSKVLYNGGIGLQLTLVTARAEAGYVWTLNSHSRPSGNVVFRMTFQNLF